jgi:hypothetical protein
MAACDEPPSLPNNLLVLHWRCGFRNNRRVRRRRLPSPHARRSQNRPVPVPYQQKCTSNKQKFSCGLSLRLPPHLIRATKSVADIRRRPISVASERPFAPCPTIHYSKPIASRERSSQIDVPATPIKVSDKLCAIYPVQADRAAYRGFSRPGFLRSRYVDLTRHM